MGVVNDLRFGEVDPLTAGLDLAVAGGQHIADPLTVGAVCERDDAAVIGAKQVDRRPIDAPGPPADMCDKRKPRKPTGHLAKYRVGDGAVEPRQCLREWHRGRYCELPGKRIPRTPRLAAARLRA